MFPRGHSIPEKTRILYTFKGIIRFIFIGALFYSCVGRYYYIVLRFPRYFFLIIPPSLLIRYVPRWGRLIIVMFILSKVT